MKKSFYHLAQTIAIKLENLIDIFIEKDGSAMNDADRLKYRHLVDEKMNEIFDVGYQIRFNTILKKGEVILEYSVSGISLFIEFNINNLSKDTSLYIGTNGSFLRATINSLVEMDVNYQLLCCDVKNLSELNQISTDLFEIIK